MDINEIEELWRMEEEEENENNERAIIPYGEAIPISVLDADVWFSNNRTERAIYAEERLILGRANIEARMFQQVALGRLPLTVDLGEGRKIVTGMRNNLISEIPPIPNSPPPKPLVIPENARLDRMFIFLEECRDKLMEIC